MPGRKVLVLGGTREARDLAAALQAEGYDTIYSLAGVTREPQLPAVMTRQGGFGGADGLADYLLREYVSAVADATHPFAAQMSAHAHVACMRLGLPLLRLERPAWQPGPADCWIAVASPQQAAKILPADARPMVTIGRKDIGWFFARDDISGIARMVEKTALDVPAGWTLLLERPPFTCEQEAALITRHAITHLVSKNAGSTETCGKLEAARMLGIPVVMIARPVKPACPIFPDVKEFILALGKTLLP
jgi:precorrin-6A/cobalt-precorrin-6A reductase